MNAFTSNIDPTAEALRIIREVGVSQESYEDFAAHLVDLGHRAMDAFCRAHGADRDCDHCRKVVCSESEDCMCGKCLDLPF